MEYNKSVAKIDANSGDSQPQGSTAAHPAIIFEESRRHIEEPEKNFGYWLKVGLAVTLPLIIALIVLAAAIIFWRSH